MWGSITKGVTQKEAPFFVPFTICELPKMDQVTVNSVPELNVWRSIAPKGARAIYLYDGRHRSRRARCGKPSVLAHVVGSASINARHGRSWGGERKRDFRCTRYVKGVGWLMVEDARA